MNDFLEVPVSDEDVDLPIGFSGIAEYHPKVIPGWRFISDEQAYFSSNGWSVAEHVRSDRWSCSTRMTCPEGVTWTFPCGWFVGRDLRRLCSWVEEHGWPEGWLDA